MPKPKNRQSTDESTIDVESLDPNRTILVDCNCVVAAAEGQREVQHIRSPMMTFLPIAGVDRWATQPGLNVHVTAKTWDDYADNHRQIKAKMASGEIKVLDGLPTTAHDIEELVTRTLGHDALAYILAAVEAGEIGTFSGGNQERRRESLISMIKDRIEVANPVKVRVTAWRAREEKPANSFAM